MLNHVQKLGVIYKRKLFFWLPPFPIQWNLSTSQLEWLPLRKMKWSVVYLAVAMLLNILHGIASGAVLIGGLLNCSFVHYKHTLNTFRMTILGFFAVANLCLNGTLGLLFWYPSIISAINQMVKLSQKLRVVNGAASISKPVSTFDILAFVVIVLVTTSSYQAFIALPVSSLDPYYYLFNMDAPSNETSEAFTFHLLKYVARMCLLTGLFEWGRSWAFIVAMVSSFVPVLLEYLVNLSSTVQRTDIHLNELMTKFKQFELIYKLAHHFLEKYISIGLTFFFWATVCIVSTLIKQSDSIPLGFLLFMSFASLILTGAFSSAIHIAADIANYSRLFIALFNLRAQAEGVNQSSNRDSGKISRKIVRYQIKALKPLKVPYPPFLYIDRNFFMLYAARLTDKLFDAVLIT